MGETGNSGGDRPSVRTSVGTTGAIWVFVIVLDLVLTIEWL